MYGGAELNQFHPETLPPDMRQAVKEKRRESASVAGWGTQLACGLKDTLSVLRRSELFTKLAIVMMVTGIVFECIQDLLFNYLIVTMGFGASDNSTVLIAIGLCALAVQVQGPHSRISCFASSAPAPLHCHLLISKA